ncbi:MAG: beta-ketoacyl-[acyl-carrier-protein] synthase family protein [Kiritimatiellae bacterium]|nr:beta-ketoacyl-[acyl-carrier-protein] synthase family protein [Kiritimatiellia bacterium]
MSERVVITGMGAVTALGLDESSLREGLFSSRAAVRRIRGFEAAPFKSRNAAEIDPDALAAELRRRKWRAQDTAIDMAMLAAAQALEQAGLISGDGPYERQNTATLFGTGSGPTRSTCRAWADYHAKGLPGIRPTTVPRCMLNAISSQISMKFGLAGANYAVVSSCASSTVALGLGFRMVRDGYVPRVLCGGSESMFDPAVYGTWDALGVMSRNPDPGAAFRPFDADRDGFVLGEGAGALVLESLGGAKRRGAPIRAEICGYGEASDAAHITRPSVEGQLEAIHAAFACAGLGPADIGLVNAHGTATQANDACESRSIREALGGEADRIPVVSSKPFFGHLIGAAGAVETAVTVLCLEAGRAHSNLNLDRRDPLCDLHFVGDAPVDLAKPVAMKTSFGFGGNNGVLIVRRFEEDT